MISSITKVIHMNTLTHVTYIFYTKGYKQEIQVVHNFITQIIIQHIKKQEKISVVLLTCGILFICTSVFRLLLFIDHYLYFMD